MNKKTKVKIRFSIMGVVLLFMGMLFCFSIVTPLFNDYYSKSADYVLEGYVKNESLSFYIDILKVATQYDIIYSGDANEPFFKRYTYKDFFDSDGNLSIDCEDYSTLVFHIAKQYEIECRFYYETNYLGVRKHQGVECFILNEWKELN